MVRGRVSATPRLPTRTVRGDGVGRRYKRRGEAVAKESARDGAPSVFARLNLAPHACAVGRLDVNSEGLLVITSDGALARAMEHPEIGGLERRYEVLVHGRVTPSKVAAFRRGVAVKGVRYKPMATRVVDSRPNRATLARRRRGRRDGVAARPRPRAGRSAGTSRRRGR